MVLEKTTARETTAAVEKDDSNGRSIRIDTLLNKSDSFKRTVDIKEDIINVADLKQFKQDKDELYVKFKCTQRRRITKS